MPKERYIITMSETGTVLYILYKKVMDKRISNPEGSKSTAADYYDLSAEASKRPHGGTEEARQAESDDINEESTQGPVSSPKGDDWAENKIATSLDDE
jgi:hypothetical protein